MHWCPESRAQASLLILLITKGKKERKKERNEETFEKF
jgi:hypothetical protein